MSGEDYKNMEIKLTNQDLIVIDHLLLRELCDYPASDKNTLLDDYRDMIEDARKAIRRRGRR